MAKLTRTVDYLKELAGRSTVAEFFAAMKDARLSADERPAHVDPATHL